MHLGDVLETVRRQRFVGRGRELASFDDAIHQRSPGRVLFVHGQGGIGKTTLLLQLCARAQAAGRTVVQVDGRDADPSPQGMQTAILTGLDHRHDYRHDDGHDRQPLVVLPAGTVLLVDGYEQLTPIDGWLRNEFIPELSADTVVVLAGRDPPSPPWRADPGWPHLVAVHRLEHFDPVESGDLLAHAGVTQPARAHLIRLGRGHPLTMALLADLAAGGQIPDTLAEAPDLISTLLESFLHDVPSQAHLIGLAACAIAWLTTEDLLTQLVSDDAPAVWQWLTRRPFISSSPRGLFAHDLARDVLDAEFERRAPQRYRAYHQIIHAHTVAGLRAATGLDRQLYVQHLLFLNLKSPVTSAPFLALRARGSIAVVAARLDDHDPVCEIIERFEGPASAVLARAWLAEQPEHLSVVRTGDGVAGFAFHVLCPNGSVLEDRDPVVRAVLDHIARTAPLRPGEQVDIVRFCAGAREHQRDPYAFLAGYVSHSVEMLTRPRAWSVLTGIDPEYAAAALNQMAFTPLVEIDVAGIRHFAYGIDWRRISLAASHDLMRERKHSGETGPPPAALLRPLPLDRARFATAVKNALKTLHRPDQLATNPLIGTALATTATGPDPNQLRTTIEGAVAHLGNQPKGDQLRAVLNRTYLHAAPTQEAAAQVLDLPLSTYRRYLTKAHEQLTDLLWTIEIGGERPPAEPGS